MTKPRQSQVSLDATPYYHCIARCVRRAFLCGEDDFSGRNFEHRRQWIVERLKELAGIFAIDICAYAVMSNHYHVVVHIDRKQAEAWTNQEVMERWHRLFHGQLLVDRYQAGEPMTAAELDVVKDIIRTWRERLHDLSWFMRCLNETIARRANEEDGCTGRFWEGRYKSQALLDEAALLTCMSYVDLNPIRAGLAETPETSDFTSIQERIIAFAKSAPQERHTGQDDAKQTSLLPFIGNERQDQPKGIPLSLPDYLQLVDWTGRAIREDKRGAIPSDLAPILERLGIEPTEWLGNVKHYGQRFHRVIGAIERLTDFCVAVGQRWLRGQSSVKRMYRSSSDWFSDNCLGGVDGSAAETGE